MRHVFGLVMAGGLVLGQAIDVKAQVTISAANPYTGAGPSVTVGQPATGAYYGQQGYAVPYAQTYGVPYANRPVYSRGYITQGYSAPPPGVAYSSAYQGYSNPTSPYYNQGYYGSSYTTPTYGRATAVYRDSARPYYYGGSRGVGVPGGRLLYRVR